MTCFFLKAMEGGCWWFQVAKFMVTLMLLPAACFHVTRLDF